MILCMLDGPDVRDLENVAFEERFLKAEPACVFHSHPPNIRLIGGSHHAMNVVVEEPLCHSAQVPCGSRKDEHHRRLSFARLAWRKASSLSSETQCISLPVL